MSSCLLVLAVRQKSFNLFPKATLVNTDQSMYMYMNIYITSPLDPGGVVNILHFEDVC